MGAKTSIVAQTDFLLPSLIKPCHRPTRLTGKNNVAAFELLKSRGLAGLTVDELIKEQGLISSTAGTCLAELRWLGLARKTEARRNGRTVFIAIGDKL